MLYDKYLILKDLINNLSLLCWEIVLQHQLFLRIWKKDLALNYQFVVFNTLLFPPPPLLLAVQPCLNWKSERWMTQQHQILIFAIKQKLYVKKIFCKICHWPLFPKKFLFYFCRVNIHTNYIHYLNSVLCYFCFFLMINSYVLK